ncbi:hypothetical protein MP228_004742 [Amoeboaphelidium protococcarum]|nr:hypothetical protein MP228_004742 [Amoeboaphelidium protococcarum]
MAAYNTAASILLWSFLPSFLSTVVLRVFYATIGPLFVKRFNASPDGKRNQALQYQIHWRYTLLILLSLYLGASIVEPLYGQINIGNVNTTVARQKIHQNPLITEFQITPENFTTRALKSAFKKKSLAYHPDKIQNQDAAAGDAEQSFLRIRALYEILNNPLTRSMFVVFGPDAEQCSTISSSIDANLVKANEQFKCKTLGDFYWNQMMKVLGFYGGLVSVVYFIELISGALSKTQNQSSSVLHNRNQGLWQSFGIGMKSVRYLIFLLAFAIEMDLIHGAFSQSAFIASKDHQNAMSSDANQIPSTSNTLYYFRLRAIWQFLNQFAGWRSCTISDQIQILRSWALAIVMFMQQSLPVIRDLLTLWETQRLQRNSQVNSGPQSGSVDLKQYMTDQSLLLNALEYSQSQVLHLLALPSDLSSDADGTPQTQMDGIQTAVSDQEEELGER